MIAQVQRMYLKTAVLESTAPSVQVSRNKRGERSSPWLWLCFCFPPITIGGRIDTVSEFGGSEFAFLSLSKLESIGA